MLPDDIEIKRASGVILMTPDRRVLFLQRSGKGDHAGEWCFPGGGVESGEDAETAAIRETREETGHIIKGGLKLHCRRVAIDGSAMLNADGPQASPESPPLVPLAPPPAVDFSTFLNEVKNEFVPELDDGEHTGYCWAPIDQPPEPMHPGARIAIARFTMNELDIARAMSAGELSSPQQYENVWLFAIRITGTNVSYRTQLKEYVFREPALYMNDEFVQRCNGLPVIWEHPPSNVMNSKEFASRIVGTIFLPYLVPEREEVWGIAKIYDQYAIKVLNNKQMSTSPAVVFKPQDGNVKVPTDDGKHLLIEGKPSLLDHLAICEHGVWDKGGEPTGVKMDADLVGARGDSAMAEEKKEEKEHKDDAARQDTVPDKMLTHLDSIAKAVGDMAAKLDGMGTRLDALEKRGDAKSSKKDDDDDDRKRLGDDDDDDSKHRKDAKSKRGDDDDDDDKRKDSKFKKDEEGCEEKEHEKKADKKGRKDEYEEEEKEHRKDRKSAKKDDDDDDDDKRKDSKSSKKDDDDDDDDKRKDAANGSGKGSGSRGDSDVDRRVEDRIRALYLTDEDREKVTEIQNLYEPAYRALGDSVPRHMPGERLEAFERRCIKGVQKHSKVWKDENMLTFTGSALRKVGEQIRADAVHAGRNPTDLPAGMLREVVRMDETGRPIREFYGEPRAWMDAFSGVRRRVVGFQKDGRALV